MHYRGQAQPSQFAARNTQDCAAICVETIQYCLEVGGNHVAPSHMQLLQDCADICDTTTKFVVRRSRQHAQVSAACADLCDLCAESCEKFIGDPQMKACANQCRLCASACRQMLASAISDAAGLAGRAAGFAGAGLSGAGFHGAGGQTQGR